MSRWSTFRPRGGSDEPLADLAQLPLQLVDLVAEAGGLLEPQVASRVLHLVGEVLDQPRELVARHVETIRRRCLGRRAHATAPAAAAAAAARGLVAVARPDHLE